MGTGSLNLQKTSQDSHIALCSLSVLRHTDSLNVSYVLSSHLQYYLGLQLQIFFVRFSNLVGIVGGRQAGLAGHELQILRVTLERLTALSVKLQHKPRKIYLLSQELIVIITSVNLW